MMSDSPAEWYASLPAVSKFWFTSCAFTTIGFHAKFVSPASLYLSWPLVIDKFQPWRLLTNFMFLGKFSISFAIRMMMLVNYAVPLEKVHFGEQRTGDFMTFLLFGVLTLTPLHYVAPSIAQPFYGDSLIFMCLYLWSRENPKARVSIMGFVRTPAFYFPWAMLALTALMGGDPVPDFLGIVAGHLYYFLASLYPRHSGRRSIIQTPKFIQSFADYITGGRGVVGAAANSFQAPRTRYFAGRGRRLAD
jgi:Derlin-2/3